MTRINKKVIDYIKKIVPTPKGMKFKCIHIYYDIIEHNDSNKDIDQHCKVFGFKK